jgi:DMSO reductase anchor subunit
MATGCAGVFCSVMIYVFTQREYWSLSRTALRFGLTAALLGFAATWLTLLIGKGIGRSHELGSMSTIGPTLARGLIFTALCKLCTELILLRRLAEKRNTPLRRSAKLIVGPLSNVTLARVAAGILGGIVMPAFLLQSFGADPPPGDLFLLLTVTILFLACLLGELLERYLFFAAVSSPRMPGGLRP